MLIKKISLLLAAAALTAAFTAPASHAELTFDSNVPADLKAEMLQDLALTATLQGEKASANYQEIFGTAKLDGAGLLSFFEKRIFRVGMNSCGGGTSVAACVIPGRDNNKMWITPNYSRFNAPQIYRLAVVLHESRHSEPAARYWSHATCPTPYRDENGNDIKGIMSGALMAGKPACDSVLQGAYGLQATFFKDVERNCTTCTEKVKQDSQLYGDDTILRISSVPARQKLRKDLNGG